MYLEINKKKIDKAHKEINGLIPDTFPKEAKDHRNL
jgi:hypothetical protein